MTRTSFVIVLTAAAAAQSLEAQSPQAGLRPVRIRDVTVVDGPGGVRPRMDVVLRDGRIASVTPASSDTAFEGSQVDGRGLWLIPGLVDAHVHLGDNPTPDARRLLRWGLEGGVTTVRDMAGDARRLAGLKTALISGEITGPSIYYSALMAGPAFMSDPRLRAATRGYAGGEAPYMIPLTDTTDLPLAVARAKGTGATAIKLYAALDAELVRLATREAHRQGLRVWAHSAIFPAKPVEILDAGVDAVSHSPYVIWEAAPPTDDFTLRARGDFDHVSASGPEMKRVIDAMLRNHTVLDPTLFVFTGDTTEALARRRLAWGAEFTRLAHESGVTIDAGTDFFGRPLAGELPSVHVEMELLVRRAGFTPLEALTAATMGGAMAIGIQDRIGSIEPGKDADLVLLAADPAVDIRNTRRIAGVFKAGRRIR